MVVGLLCLVALGFWSAFADLKYPLMPRRLFKKVRRVTMVLGVCFCGGMLYCKAFPIPPLPSVQTILTRDSDSMNVLWPRQSQQLFTGNDPITKGLYAEQIPLGTILAGLITIFICSHIGHERWQLVFFEVVQTALIGSLASVGLDDKIQAICTVVALSSMVTPPQLLSFTMLSLGIDDQEDIGLAVGLASTFRLLGGAVATAVYTAITNNGFSSHIAGDVTANVAALDFPAASLPALINAASLNTAAAYQAVPGITPRVIAACQLAVKQAYVSAFHTTYLSAIGFGGLAIIAAVCTKDTDVRKKTGNRAVLLENERREEDVEKVAS
jgi:hypothetical protein